MLLSHERDRAQNYDVYIQRDSNRKFEQPEPDDVGNPALQVFKLQKQVEFDKMLQKTRDLKAQGKEGTIEARQNRTKILKFLKEFAAYVIIPPDLDPEIQEAYATFEPGIMKPAAAAAAAAAAPYGGPTQADFAALFEAQTNATKAEFQRLLDEQGLTRKEYNAGLKQLLDEQGLTRKELAEAVKEKGMSGEQFGEVMEKIDQIYADKPGVSAERLNQLLDQQKFLIEAQKRDRERALATPVNIPAAIGLERLASIGKRLEQQELSLARDIDQKLAEASLVETLVTNAVQQNPDLLGQEGAIDAIRKSVTPAARQALGLDPPGSSSSNYATPANPARFNRPESERMADTEQYSEQEEVLDDALINIPPDISDFPTIKPTSPVMSRGVKTIWAALSIPERWKYLRDNYPNQYETQIQKLKQKSGKGMPARYYKKRGARKGKGIGQFVHKVKKAAHDTDRWFKETGRKLKGKGYIGGAMVGGAMVGGKAKKKKTLSTYQRFVKDNYHEMKAKVRAKNPKISDCRLNIATLKSVAKKWKASK